MKRPQRNRPLVYALYANAILLLAILVTLLTRPSLPSANGAIAPQPIAGNGNLYLMPGQLLNNVWGCYVMDVDNQTLCTYSYNGSQLRLMASRSIRYDHELEAYNTFPDPDEIRRLVQLQKPGNRGAAAPVPRERPATQPELNK